MKKAMGIKASCGGQNAISRLQVFQALTNYCMNSQIAETAEHSAVCQKWSTGTDEADRKGIKMWEKIIELIQDAAAAISVFAFLAALYLLMAAAG